MSRLYHSIVSLFSSPLCSNCGSNAVIFDCDCGQAHYCSPHCKTRYLARQHFAQCKAVMSRRYPKRRIATVETQGDGDTSSSSSASSDDDWSVLYVTTGRSLRDDELKRQMFSEFITKQRREQNGDVDDSTSDDGNIKRVAVLTDILSEYISERALIALTAEYSPGLLSQVESVRGIDVNNEQQMNRAIATVALTVADCQRIVRLHRIMIEYDSHDQGWASHGVKGTASTSATAFAVQTVSSSGRVTELHRGSLANNDTANRDWQHYRFVFNADHTSVMGSDTSDSRTAEIYSTALPWYNYHMTTINKFNETIERMRESATATTMTDNDTSHPSQASDDDCRAVQLVLIGRSEWAGWTFSSRNVKLRLQYVLNKQTNKDDK